MGKKNQAVSTSTKDVIYGLLVAFMVCMIPFVMVTIAMFLCVVAISRVIHWVAYITGSSKQRIYTCNCYNEKRILTELPQLFEEEGM
ncbi:hypothetical protein D4R87_02780 [bacterium]|nr:MAG: hypothetical protein D4R87_02780 [bacterium]